MKKKSKNTYADQEGLTAMADMRMEELAGRLEKLEREKEGPWSKFKAVSPLISTVLVAAMGFWATYSITGAIERERLDLSHLEAMRDLLAAVGTPNAEKTQAEASAVLLGAFGSHAVAPLVHELDMPGEVRPLAALKGLRTAAFNDPEATVAILVRVLENRSGLFSWQTHQYVVSLLGEIGNRQALPILNELRVLLSTAEGRNAYKDMVRQEGAPTEKNLSSMQETVDSAIKKLQNGSN